MRLPDSLLPWGYNRIQGALANLGHEISDSTVGSILRAHAIDFATIENWTKDGLTTFYLLFVMEIATRRVCLAGCTPNPDDLWMMQMARNLTDVTDGFLLGKRYLLMDRDAKCSEGFRSILKQSGTGSVRLPTVTGAIVGGRSPAQVEGVIGAMGFRLTRTTSARSRLSGHKPYQ